MLFSNLSIKTVVLRCFESRNIPSLIADFKTYVRPVLEYCSVVWNPFLIKDIDKLEKVQRRFTKRLPGLKHYTYFQRLNRLDLESLELRRLRQDLIFTYKLVFGLVDVDVHDFFRCSFEKVRRGHGCKLFCPHATHLPVLILSHTEYCASGMFCHMTPILVRLHSKVLLAQTFWKNF